MTTHPEGLTRPVDDSRALSAQGTNVGAPHGAIRARQGEDEAAAVMTTGGGVGFMPCLSVRAPWWWWIMYGGKDIENRDWHTDYRGPCAIHASKWWTNVGFQEAWEDARDMAGTTSHLAHLSEKWTPRKIKELGGHIVGIVDIVGCATASKSPWFVGKYGFVLANPRPLAATVPFIGKLGFFKVPRDLLQTGGISRQPE